MNWIEIYNRLFEIINEAGDNYYSGPKFINVVREFNPYYPDYNQYIEDRRTSKKSTSRKDYFRDILFSFDDQSRIKIVRRILKDTHAHNPSKTTELNSVLGGEVTAPTVRIKDGVWGADRLNNYLEDIDASITEGNHERAISLSYTCLEGFYKAFIKRNIPEKSHLNEIISMSKEIQQHLRGIVGSYPNEAFKLINHITHAVDKSRNNFSESHFGEEAGKWLSTFIRDCVNSNIRLLLAFLK